MTREEQIRIVAEFDGWKINKGVNFDVFSKDGNEVIDLTGLEYHVSFDAQIPVWQKWRKQVDEVCDTIEKCDEVEKIIMRFTHYIFNYTPEQSFEILTEAIQWYNKQMNSISPTR